MGNETESKQDSRQERKCERYSNEELAEMAKSAELKNKSTQERIDKLMAGPKGLEMIQPMNPKNWLWQRSGECEDDFQKRRAEWDSWIEENNRQYLIKQIMPMVEEEEAFTGRKVYLDGKPITRERLEKTPAGDFGGSPNSDGWGLCRIWTLVLTMPRSPEEQEAIRESMANLDEYQEALELEDIDQEDDLEMTEEEWLRDVAKQSVRYKMEKLMGRIYHGDIDELIDEDSVEIAMAEMRLELA